MSLKLQVFMALLVCATAFRPAAAEETATTADTATATTADTATTAAVSGPCNDVALSEGQSKCVSCSQISTCSEGAIIDTFCPGTKACFQDGDDSATCLSFAYTECNACSDNQFTICDPFDEQIVNVCVPGRAPVAYDTCGDGETCQTGVCVAGTASPGSGGGLSDVCSDATEGDAGFAIVAYKPECTSGLLCSGSNVLNIINCTQGQYFNPTTGACSELPINNCEGTGDGIFTLQTDCSKAVLCQDGKEVAQYECGEGKQFNEESISCEEESADYKCPGLNGCTFEPTESGGSGSATTTVSSSNTKPEECTADNVNDRYPVDGDCKSYWTCRKTSGSTYAYVKYECMGTLVYNPSTAYCDLPENVAGCA